MHGTTDCRENNAMPLLQRIVQIGRRVLPRGWSFALRRIAKLHPSLQTYPATLASGDTLHVNLAEDMCHGYFYHGRLEHEQYAEELFKLVLRPGGCAYDIGANIGYFTRVLSKIVGNNGRIRAFEPMPSALRLLRINTADLSNVFIHDLAVTDNNGVAPFAVRAHGDTSSLGESKDGSLQINVDTVRLDDLRPIDENVSLIKIDVEGYELEVLKGATKVIASCRPILYFEFIPAYATRRGIRLDDFENLLRPLGYELRWINPQFPYGPLVSSTPSSYLIAARGEAWPDLLNVT